MSYVERCCENFLFNHKIQLDDKHVESFKYFVCEMALGACIDSAMRKQVEEFLKQYEGKQVC